MSDDEAANGPENPEKGGHTRDDSVTEPFSPALPPEAPLTSDITVVGDAADEFHRRARLAEDRLAEVLTSYRKLKAENDEYRERTTRNIERKYDQRRERLVLKFIDILDNLDRALEAAEQSYTGNPLIEGLILVRTQLLQTLQEEGLERMPCLGLAFDPALAEAVGSQPVEDPDHHHLVVKELARGYRLHGRIARPARVLIGEYAGFTATSVPVEAEPVAVEAEPLPVAEPLMAEAEAIPELMPEVLPEADAALAAPEPSRPEEPLLAEVELPAAEAELPEAEAELPEVDAPLALASIDEPSPVPDELEPFPEPTLELIPDGEENSLEEIIAAAERQEAGMRVAGAPAAPSADSDPPLFENTALESVEDEDELLREAFGVPYPKGHKE